MEDDNDSVVIPFVPTEHDALSTDIGDLLPPGPAQRSDSPITKRARRQDSCSSLSALDTFQSLSRLSQGSDIPHRDLRFYMADGSCVLRVGNTLFNVRFSYDTARLRQVNDRYCRSTAVFYQRTLLRLAPCLLFLRATSPWKARRMTTQSSCTGILLRSSAISCGPYMPCKALNPVSDPSLIFAQITAHTK